MAQNNINLADLFGAAASALSQNQGALNQADSYNQNHGDNMVQIFNLINQAIAEKPTASASDQLAYAGRVVQRQASSGSAKVYAGALQTASQQMQGQPLNQDTAMSLITSLLGGGQPAQAAGHPAGYRPGERTYWVHSPGITHRLPARLHPAREGRRSMPRILCAAAWPI